MSHRSATLALLLATAAPALAAPPVTPMTPDVVARYDAVRPEADYVRRTAMVPMRDGVKLYTVIVMKKGTHDGPILLSRTPYDAEAATTRTASQRITEILPIMDKEFAEDGYIRVYQDIRGQHRSEGVFVMTRPIVGPLNHTTVDESTDAYDTIDWLVKNVPEGNGRVGVVGSSYLGFTTLMAEINPHPALKAAVPQSPMVDTWIGDDDFHNGAFRAGSFDYFLDHSVDKAAGHTEIPRGVEGDDYTAYLRAGSLGDFARAWGVQDVPSVRKVMENPAYTDFWSLQAVDKWLAARPLTVPTMLVVGQWDQEDSYGAPAVYRALEPKDTANTMVSLVIGPWRHSGVNHYGASLGQLSFTGDTALQFRVRYMKPFFDHWLKGAPDPHTPPVLTYATGANRWEVSPKWPMGQATPLYLDADGGATFAKPAAGRDSYVSDPANPVPFSPRPVQIADRTQWTTWLVRDQRFATGRPDVLSYRSAALDHPVHIMGAPEVALFAATSGTDSDWVVKLIDVYPNDTPEAGEPSNPGFELPVGIEIFRGRYVHDRARPAALTPNKVEQYRWSLPNVDHVFLPGHRIMVQVQSSLFPLYDRNPQTFVPNIFNAPAASYRAATQTVAHGGGQASAVYLPIVAAGDPQPVAAD